MLVLGIDPGLRGALAVYDKNTASLVYVKALPVFCVEIGGKSRTRLDKRGLLSDLDAACMCGVELAILEKVHGMPRKTAWGSRETGGAASLFNFGYVYGVIDMAATAVGLRVEEVLPASWKATMKVPGKSGGPKRSVAAIIQRADQMFPDHASLWRGPRGGLLDGLAEAAMLAKYGADYVK